MANTPPRLCIGALLLGLGCASQDPVAPPIVPADAETPIEDARPARDSGAPESKVSADGTTPPAPDAATPTATADAAVDTAPARNAGVETVRLAAGGPAVAFKTALAAGEIYLLKATGAVTVAGQMVDAEYAIGAGGAAADEAGGADVGVDIGMKQIQRHVHYTPTPPGPGRMKWYGAYRADHVYYMTVTGDGKPLSLALTAPAGAGAGEIAVSLIPLSPAPPKIEPELETVMVPVAKTQVMSTMTTQEGKLYLLQASGAGKVGGGGLHMGDAEYMDWDEVGNRANEGEAGADFGIGVDEIEFMRMGGAAYKPRQRWWGPWRKDHTYYLLFTGTGKVIQFLYFDSGYGDNSPTDKLSVRIFAAP